MSILTSCFAALGSFAPEVSQEPSIFVREEAQAQADRADLYV